ncbi:MAG: hypothetical protein HRU15_15345 [Planctomycetes bacterium]|nr:hypothetical protein [Planctomycetota bacterium]
MLSPLPIGQFKQVSPVANLAKRCPMLKSKGFIFATYLERMQAFDFTQDDLIIMIREAL